MEKYTFKEEGKEVEVDQEQWGWLAIYKDGSSLTQFDAPTKTFHQFKEIDMDELDIFAVYNTQSPGDNTKRYEIHMEEGMTPIFFSRITVFNMKEPGEVKVRVPHFGYKENIAGVSVKTIMAIHPSGALSIMNTDGK